jgi:hypothetical protein
MRGQATSENDGRRTKISHLKSDKGPNHIVSRFTYEMSCRSQQNRAEYEFRSSITYKSNCNMRLMYCLKQRKTQKRNAQTGRKNYTSTKWRLKRGTAKTWPTWTKIQKGNEPT